MNDINFLKKYAVKYLSKYDSTKKNLERILTKKIMTMKDLEKDNKIILKNSIKKILDDFVDKKIIDDNKFTNRKINFYIHQGKSKNFIVNMLLTKGIEKELIYENFIKLENTNIDWQYDSATIFAKKKKLGKYGNLSNKKKDLAKMSRAGFNYQITLRALGYD